MLGITHATYPKIMTVMSINEDNEDHDAGENYGDDDDKGRVHKKNPERALHMYGRSFQKSCPRMGFQRF